MQKWAEAHPVITNADKFEEVFGTIDLLAMHGIMGMYDNWWNREYNAPEKKKEGQKIDGKA